MIIFILIFFALVFISAVAAVAGFSIYLTRRRRLPSLETINQKQFEDAPPYRSLFEPSGRELRAFEREEQIKRDARKKEAERKTLFEKSEKVREFEKIWRAEPTRQNTLELFRLAAASQSAEVFSQTAENVIQVARHGQAGNLSKKDLADLLDSHLRILPQQERFSGAVFWVKREIERLRRKSEVKS